MRNRDQGYKSSSECKYRCDEWNPLPPYYFHYACYVSRVPSSFFHWWNQRTFYKELVSRWLVPLSFQHWMHWRWVLLFVPSCWSQRVKKANVRHWSVVSIPHSIRPIHPYWISTNAIRNSSLIIKVISIAIVVVGINGNGYPDAYDTYRTGSDEDVGTVFCTVSLHSWKTSKTQQTMDKDWCHVGNQSLPSRVVRWLPVINFMAGQGSNFGTFIIKLKNWSERGKGQSSTDVIGGWSMDDFYVEGCYDHIVAPPWFLVSLQQEWPTFQYAGWTGGDVEQVLWYHAAVPGQVEQRPEFRLPTTRSLVIRNIWMSMSP